VTKGRIAEARLLTESCESIAVVLFQLGGPDSLDAVEPFLSNIFSDPDIIDFPFARLARPSLARLISSRRARHVQQHYASLGGKSPIRELTARQAVALESELRKTAEVRVFVAMRYWHPLTEEVVERIIDGNFRDLVLLPLYPQYSKTTTGSSLNEWHRQYPARAREFCAYPGYLDAVVERINEGLERFTDRGRDGPSLAEGPRAVASLRPPVPDDGDIAAADDVHLVFSAHGVPVRVIEAGDPYQKQIEETVRLVMERGRWSNPHVLCWQSRVNPGKWLEPSLGETLRALSARRAERVLVIPISFVTDHVETLAEIDIEARALAYQAGIRQFELMPALNDSATFIRALADLVLAQLATPASAAAGRHNSPHSRP
jgi:ferrochelatase